MKAFRMREIVIAIFTSGMLSISTEAMASAFQLWEQDGASIGNYHAGYAAEANDASTAWYNPAGIPRIQNQQLVIGGAAILPRFSYNGSVTVSNTFPPPLPPMDSNFFPNVHAQGGTFNIVPNIHYVAPITETIGFGFSVDVPFGLETDYGSDTPLRYVATLTKINVIDFGPSLGFRMNDHASFGIGLDVQKVTADFNNVGVSTSTPDSDTPSKNNASGTGYGFHLGGLYEFTPEARVGLSYHSAVDHHLTGRSDFTGPLADALNNGPIHSHAYTNLTLPDYIALSGYDKILPQVAVMGSIIYTQWDTFDTLKLNGVSGIANAPFPIILVPSTNISVSIPEKYRNTWNFSVGADYFINDKFKLRGGVGYDQSPVRESLRNVQLPDIYRYVLALGGHYQATKCIGLDLGWTHLFFPTATVNPPPLVMGAQVTATTGRVSGSADVIGAQVTWDIL